MAHGGPQSDDGPATELAGYRNVVSASPAG